MNEFSSINKDFVELREISNPGSYDTPLPEKRAEAKEKRNIHYFFGEEGLKIHEQQWK